MKKTSNKDPFFVYVDGESQDLFTEYDDVSSKLFTETRFFRISKSNILPSSDSPKTLPDVLLFKDGSHVSFQASKTGKSYDQIKLILFIEDQSLSQWTRAERWPLNPLITSSNVHLVAEDTNKKLVLAVIDMIEKLNANSTDGR